MARHIPNKKSGSCWRCNRFVRARDGSLEPFVNVGTNKEVWRILCTTCKPIEPRRPANEVLSEAEAAVLIGPTAEPEILTVDLKAKVALCGDIHDVMKGELEDASVAWDKANRGWRLGTADLVAAIPKIKASGIRVALADTVTERLLAELAALEKRDQDAAEHVAKMQASYLERGLSLRPYQGVGARFLRSRIGNAAGLFDQMGLGKTPITLTALPPGHSVVVVCPASVVGVWVFIETPRWRPDYKAGMLRGRGKWSRWPDPGTLVAMSWETLPRDRPPEGAGTRCVLIFDEAHKAINPDTLVTRRARCAAHNVLDHGGTVWELTGTPLRNTIDDIFHVLELGRLGTRAFGSLDNLKALAGEGPPGQERIAARMRAVSLARLKRDVLTDLPPKVYADIPVEVTPEAKKRLDEVVERILEAAVERRRKDIERDHCISAGVLSADQLNDRDRVDFEKAMERATEEARQRIDEAIELALDGEAPIPFDFISQVKSLLASLKAPAALRYVAENDAAFVHEDDADFETEPGYQDPWVLFSSHVEPISTAAKNKDWAKIDGGEGQGSRAQAVADFQAGKLAGLAITIKAGGEGLTLTRSSRCAFVDLEWTHAANSQAVGRLDRFGAQRHARITIYRFVLQHVLDEKIAAITRRKAELAEGTHERSAVKPGEAPRSEETAQLAGVLAQVQAATKPSINAGNPKAPRAVTSLDAVLVKQLRTMAGGGNGLAKSLVKQLDRAGTLTTGQWDLARKLVTS